MPDPTLDTAATAAAISVAVSVSTGHVFSEESSFEAALVELERVGVFGDRSDLRLVESLG